MFSDIKFLRHDRAKETNYLLLTDYCLNSVPFEIETVRPSPSLKKSNMTNAIVALTLFRFYEQANRRIPREMARYYKQMFLLGFRINNDFIETQINCIDQILNTSYKNRYYQSIIRYFKDLKITQIIGSGNNFDDFNRLFEQFDAQRG